MRYLINLFAIFFLLALATAARHPARNPAPDTTTLATRVRHVQRTSAQAGPTQPAISSPSQGTTLHVSRTMATFFLWPTRRPSGSNSTGSSLAPTAPPMTEGPRPTD